MSLLEMHLSGASVRAACADREAPCKRLGQCRAERDCNASARTRFKQNIRLLILLTKYSRVKRQASQKACYDCIWRPEALLAKRVVCEFVLLCFAMAAFSGMTRTHTVWWSIVLLFLLAVEAPAAAARRVLILHAFGHAYSPLSDMAARFRADD